MVTIALNSVIPKVKRNYTNQIPNPAKVTQLHQWKPIHVRNVLYMRALSEPILAAATRGRPMCNWYGISDNNSLQHKATCYQATKPGQSLSYLIHNEPRSTGLFSLFTLINTLYLALAYLNLYKTLISLFSLRVHSISLLYVVALVITPWVVLHFIMSS